MKIEIKRLRGEWAFSITIVPGIFWFDFFYFSFSLMTTKFIKEHKLNDI